MALHLCDRVRILGYHLCSMGNELSAWPEPEFETIPRDEVLRAYHTTEGRLRAGIADAYARIGDTARAARYHAESVEHQARAREYAQLRRPSSDTRP